MSDVEKTLTERGSRYGDYAPLARVSQNIKSAMRDSPNWNTLSPDKKESLEMIASKLARVLSGDPEYDDNFRDIAGFATLAERECLPGTASSIRPGKN